VCLQQQLQQRLVAADLPVNRKVVIAALVAAGAVAGVAVYARGCGGGRHHAHADTASVHAAGFDSADSAVSFEAMMNAPEGATPCESAYAAVEAEQQATKLRGTKSIFEWVAPKPEFLASCQALTPAQQKCMAPRYRHEHAEECQQARPSPDTLAKLIRGVPVPEPSVEHP
jgi:hypothetical protein